MFLPKSVTGQIYKKTPEWSLNIHIGIEATFTSLWINLCNFLTTLHNVQTALFGGDSYLGYELPGTPVSSRCTRVGLDE